MNIECRGKKTARVFGAAAHSDRSKIWQAIEQEFAMGARWVDIKKI